MLNIFLSKIAIFLLLHGYINYHGHTNISPIISQALKEYCLQNELLDKREITYILKSESELQLDLDILVDRYRQLNDAPHVCDGDRFMFSRDMLNEMLVFNKTFSNHIETGEPLRLHAHEYYHTALTETNMIYKVYDSLRDAKCEYYYVTVRRAALKSLRDQLGYSNYYNATLPPIVPLWACQEIP